ncbi:MAG TPA: sugar phosphate isomerase/epimerase family protein [Candidatus Hydrogenedentes bacterium]|nr:sugar phosphate isomerase/epimerase family protein [Candidatus Hydrogenedentota bacterium]
MAITRRQFVLSTLGGLAGVQWASRGAQAQTTPPGIRLGACDWSLQAAEPAALEIAKRIGLNGVEVSAGGPAEKLQIADPAFRQQYKALIQKTGIAVSSVAMGLLNEAPFATDPRGPAWLGQTIEAAKDLNAKVILLAFFGKGDLLDKNGIKAKEMDAVVERLKEAAPKAQAAGVILGVENTLTGKDNLGILERVKSDAVRIYYDIGNSTYAKYDVPSEIRDLKDRICQIHFKDGANYLGKGRVDVPAAVNAIQDIQYKGWIVLETAVKKDRDEDFKTNAQYVRSLFGMA